MGKTCFVKLVPFSPMVFMGKSSCWVEKPVERLRPQTALKVLRDFRKCECSTETIILSVLS